MIIDTHCHIDMLTSPESYLTTNEAKGNFTLGMTNLPSHFNIGRPYFNNLKKSRLALGFHPQLAAEHQHELVNFQRLVSSTSYIGEVGLDFSRSFIATKNSQVECFEFICECLNGKDKIVSVHSRCAEREVLNILRANSIKNVIFHWYSGSVELIKSIINEAGQPHQNLKLFRSCSKY